MEISCCAIIDERLPPGGRAPSSVGARRARGVITLLDLVPDVVGEDGEGILRRWAGGMASKRRKESVFGGG